MTEEQIKFIHWLAGLFLLFGRAVVVIVFLWRFDYIYPKKAYRYLFFGSLITFLVALGELLFVELVRTYTDVFLPYLHRYEIDDTFFISPFYYITEVFFYGLAFSYAIGGTWHKPLQIAAMILTLLGISNIIWGEGYKDAQTIGSLSASVFLAIIAIAYIRVLYTIRINSTSSRDSFLYISWGILLSALLSLMVYLFTRPMLDTDTLLYYGVSIFRMFLDALCFLLIAYGINLVRRS